MPKLNHPYLDVPGKAIMNQIRMVNASPRLSDGAKVLLSQILLRSGQRGLIWHRNKALAEDIGKSIKTVQRHLTELREYGAVLEGHANGFRYLCPWPKLKEKFEIAVPGSNLSDTEGQACPPRPDRIVLGRAIENPSKDLKCLAVEAQVQRA